MAGGPHPTLLAGKMLENLPELDIAVRGEAEKVLPEILQRLQNKGSLHGIANTTWRQDGRVVINPETHVVEELDAVPFPAYHLIKFERYDFTMPVAGKGEVKAINLITSRGCPFDCIFCSNTNLTGRTVRYRSPENAVEEMKMGIENYGVGFFFIQDDAFNLSAKRILNFCDQLEKEKLKINWTCIMRADNSTHELLSRMKEIGFTGGIFAIETISDHLRQDVVGKKLTREQINRALKAFNDLNLWCGINFIVSFPGETKADNEDNARYMETLDFANKESYIALNILRIYPGTRLELEAKRRGVLKEGFTWFDEKKMLRFSPGTLPGLYGTVPIYREMLSVVDIFTSMFRWKYSPNFRVDPGKESGLFLYLWMYITSIKSPRDVWMLLQIAIAWLKVIAMRRLHPLR